MNMSSIFKIIRCQGDIKVDRYMDDNDIKSKALEIGNAEDICTCESEESGLKTLMDYKNSLSCFTSSSNRYANCAVYWLIRQEEEGEFEFIETAEWE